MAFVLSSQCLPHAGQSFVRSHHRSRSPQCVVLPSSGHWSSRSPDENAGMLPGGSSQRLASLSPVDSGSERAPTPVSTMWDFASQFLPLHLEDSAAPHAACSVSPERSSWRPGASDSTAVSWRHCLAAALLGVRGESFPVSLLLLHTTLSPWFKMTTTEKILEEGRVLCLLGQLKWRLSQSEMEATWVLWVLVWTDDGCSYTGQ